MTQIAQHPLAGDVCLDDEHSPPRQPQREEQEQEQQQHVQQILLQEEQQKLAANTIKINGDNNKTPAVGNSVEFFTEEELNTRSVRDLYIERCSKARQTPSKHLLKQLPASTEDIDEVSSLDLSNVYLGWKGLQTVYPVIAACHRVVHLNMTGVGLDAGTVLPLIAILKKHGGIRELILSKNAVGTETVMKLCSVAYSRQLLYKVELEDAWVVAPLRARLQRITDINGTPAVRERSAVPKRRFEQKPAFSLVDDAPTPPPEVAPEDVPVVPAMARIAHQLRAILQRSNGKMRDLQAMFRPLVPGVCSVKSFMRVVKLLDMSAVENEFSVHEFSDVMGATVLVEGERVVRFGKIMAALRDHCFVKSAAPSAAVEENPPAANAAAAAAAASVEEANDEAEKKEVDRVFSPLVALRLGQPPTIELRDMLDDIFDSLPAILESCEMIDVDVTGVLSFDDFVVGLAAATQSQRESAEKLLCFWLDALGCGVPGSAVDAERNASSTPRSQLRVPYKAMLQSLEVCPNSQLPSTATGWEEWTPKMLREL